MSFVDNPHELLFMVLLGNPYVLFGDSFEDQYMKHEGKRTWKMFPPNAVVWFWPYSSDRWVKTELANISSCYFIRVWHRCSSLIVVVGFAVLIISKLKSRSKGFLFYISHEKKGKDKTKIENLRPISLSNCDIKICTKAIAIRTSTVLDTIIGKTQAGYVPGRQVNDNNRLLEEIINIYEETRQKAYVITLDAQKAFDSVDHKYLLFQNNGASFIHYFYFLKMKSKKFSKKI